MGDLDNGKGVVMFRFSEYAKRRRQGFKHEADRLLSQGHYWGDVAVICCVIAALIVFSVSAAADAIEAGQQEAAQKATEHQSQVVEKLEKVIVSCLSNNVIKVDGVAFECKAQSLGVNL